ncbi:MAG: 4'-phosphopantetheinyl transferase family protein [Candidatus Bathyarchaeia archaeon]
MSTVDRHRGIGLVNSAIIFHVQGYERESKMRPVFTATSACLWSELPEGGVLSENDVHLWYSSLDLDASSLQRLGSTLDVDERERAEGYCFERERVRFVAARGLLRRILGHYSGVEASELRFCYSSRGKPSLVERFGGDRIQFNLAHSSGYALYAVILDRKIGVDLERVVPVVGLEQIVNRYFSDREKAALHALAGNEQREAFFRIWTAKEAYLKACGEGLTYPLNKIDTPADPRESLCSLKIKGDRKGSRWSLEQLRPAPSFIAALVIEDR